MNQVNSYFGQNNPTSDTSDFNSKSFLVSQMMRLISTATIVRVEKITNTGDVSAVGTMDVTPLVNMLDGRGVAYKHGTIKSIIYSRLQGGKNAVILDPKVGDLGVAVFADRDTSSVRKNKKQSNPGSGRRFDMADGIWVMTVLGDAPTSYIQFTDDGKIRGSVGQNNPCEYIVASDHVQIKKRGDLSLHLTIDAKGGQILAGQSLVIAPDPYPND